VTGKLERSAAAAAPKRARAVAPPANKARPRLFLWIFKGLRITLMITSNDETVLAWILELGRSYLQQDIFKMKVTVFSVHRTLVQLLHFAYYLKLHG
jgi:hypothetical protein